MSELTDVALVLVCMTYWLAYWRVTYVEYAEPMLPKARLIRG